MILVRHFNTFTTTPGNRLTTDLRPVAQIPLLPDIYPNTRRQNHKALWIHRISGVEGA